MKFFQGIAGVTMILLMLAGALACQPVNDYPARQSPMPMTKVENLESTRQAVEETMLTQVAPLVMYDPTLVPLATKLGRINTQIDGWQTGNLQYYEDFDDQNVDGLTNTTSQFVFFPDGNGGFSWQGTGNLSSGEIQLPAALRLYSIKFKIQARGNPGFAGVILGDMSDTYPDYQISMTNDTIGFGLRNTSSLPNYQVSPSGFTKDDWYDIKVDVKQNEITISHPPFPLLQIPVSGDGEILTINKISFWTCCDPSASNTFLFDDIQVWSPESPNP